MAATINTKDIAELRARTGAGIGDCKKALEEANGDLSAAVDILRKKGIAKAEKRAGRAASEGQIIAALTADASAGALIELNSETDFVARNEEFVAAAEALAAHVLADAAVDGTHAVGTEGAYLGTAHGAQTVGETVKGISAKTGENVVLNRITRFAGKGTVGFYRHHNGKVAVLVEVTGPAGDAARTLANTIAEHIAAGVPTVPVAVDRSGVSAEFIEKEKAIFVEQAKASGKPEAIALKMVEGRINKLFGEVTLLEQPWVRDDKQTIQQLVQAAGAGYAVTRFARFQMGEA